GPAYAFYFVEALTEAGINAGLSADLSSILAKGTLAGAAQLLMESEDNAAVLRERVTSKGGTTEAALTTLMNQDFTEIINSAVLAAKARSQELGQE
ncbi:MAG: pyrroline-5-carboxylate reductase family protein, partial [Planctomycetota bacterium]